MSRLLPAQDFFVTSFDTAASNSIRILVSFWNQGKQTLAFSLVPSVRIERQNQKPRPKRGFYLLQPLCSPIVLVQLLLLLLLFLSLHLSRPRYQSCCQSCTSASHSDSRRNLRQRIRDGGRKIRDATLVGAYRLV